MARVERGLVYLRRNYPMWWQDVPHSALDMEYPETSLLPFVLRRPLRQIVPQRITESAAIYNGFLEGTWDCVEVAGRTLTKLWRAEIRKRINEAEAADVVKEAFPLTTPY